ncbi:hypothetical protein HYX08_04875 [Candidatus Woesearchaeota archaeon]|nr:hypothetical protein [Candidatus Woesearchaeota archaeon]
MSTQITRRQLLGYFGIAGAIATSFWGCAPRAESVEELEQKVAKYLVEKGEDITNRFNQSPNDIYQEFIPSNDPLLAPLRITVRKARTQNEKPYLFWFEGDLDPSEVNEIPYSLRSLRGHDFSERVHFKFTKQAEDPHKPFDQNPNGEVYISSGRYVLNDKRVLNNMLGDLTMEGREAVKNLYVYILRKAVKFYETKK